MFVTNEQNIANMRFHLSLITLLFFLNLNSLVAQQQAPEGWAIAAGWTEAHLADQHTSPLMYHSDVLTLEGRYSTFGKAFFEVGLQFQVGTNQARRHRKREGTFYEPPSLYDEQDTYDFVVNPFLSRVGGRLFARALWPIGQYSMLGISTQVRYYYAGMAGDTWQFAVADIAPAYQYSRSVHRNGSVQFSASLPLAAIVVRPNWAYDASLPDETNYFKGYLRTGTRFSSLNQLQNPRIRFGYTHQLPNDHALSVDYHLEWLSYSEPRPLRMLEHGLRLSYFL